MDVTSDALAATFDQEAIEALARQTLAELEAKAPARLGEASSPRRPARSGRTSARKASEIEVKSACGLVPVSSLDLGRAVATALRAVLGGDDVVVLRSAGAGQDPVLRKLVERLPSLVAARRQSLTDTHIEALVDAYLPADALASVMPDLEADNARAQAGFLSTHPVLTAEEVADRAGHTATNRSATANRWKAERRIFAVRARGREVYPAFQFSEGRPRRSLHGTLRALEARSGWQTAFWFITPNGGLDGSAPIERLDDGEALRAAAAQEVEAWIG